MDQRFSDYLTQYRANYTFAETERQQSDVYGVRITVTLYEYDTEAEHRDRAEILMEKDGLRYRCEGIERAHWDFFPVTVEGRPYIFFSKTLYGFTLIDPDTLTEAYDYFPEKVYDGEEAFIITDAKPFGRYLIFEGCYWGCDYIYAAYDPATHRFVDLSRAYGILSGDHHARVWGGCLHLLGDTPGRETYEVKIKEADISSLMTERGTTDF